MYICPVLPFLVFWKRQGKPPKNKDFLSLPNTQNLWKRREKRSKEQGNPRKEKNKEFPKNKERKDRVVMSVKEFRINLVIFVCVMVACSSEQGVITVAIFIF